MTTKQFDPSSSEPEQETGGKMSFFEHLVDLRKRLINSALAIAVGAMIGVSISQKVFGFIARPIQARRSGKKILTTICIIRARQVLFGNLIITLGSTLAL